MPLRVGRGAVTQAALAPSMRRELAATPYPIERLGGYDGRAAAALAPCKIVTMAHDPDAAMAAAAEQLGPELAEQVNLVRGYFWFEYMPRGMHKATGLGRLAERLGFGLEQCVAFGDSSNDLELLASQSPPPTPPSPSHRRAAPQAETGLGVAMKNARDDVKAAASMVSEYTNDEDGVGREIERLLAEGAFDA